MDKGGSQGRDCFSHRPKATAKDEVVCASAEHVNCESRGALRRV